MQLVDCTCSPVLFYHVAVVPELREYSGNFVHVIAKGMQQEIIHYLQNYLKCNQKDSNQVCSVCITTSVLPHYIFSHCDLSPILRITLRAHLHQASASTLRPLCDDASNSVLIEINGDACKWVANPFWSVITELLQH